MRTGVVVLLLALFALLAVAAWADGAVPRATPFDADADADATEATVATSAAAAGSGDAANSASGPAHAEAREAVAASATAGAAGDDVARMRVRVVDADGQPIAAATVLTFGDGAAATQTTGDDGWCTLPVRAEGDSVRLLVRAGERHRQANWVPLPELTVKLPWAGPLAGRLVDDVSGAPVAGATVRRGHGYCKHCEPDCATTAADGTFAFAALPRGEDCTFAIEAAGYPAQHAQLRLPGRGEGVAHTFRVLRGEPIAGRCVDAETLQPIAGATVERTTTTAADGSFRLLVLPERDGDVSVTFAAPGWIGVRYAIRTPQPDPTVEYRMARAAAFTGTVRTPEGEPIEGAVVYVRRDYMTATEPPRPQGLPQDAEIVEEQGLRAAADRDGRWSITGVVPGVPYHVSARHPRYVRAAAEARPAPILAAREGKVVDLVLVPLGATGTVEGVYACNGTPGPALARWQGPTRKGTIRIGQNGSFRADDVECGDVALSFLPDAYESLREPLAETLTLKRDVRLEPGQVLRLRIDQALEQAVVCGTLRYADGAAAAGASVSLHEPRTYAKTGDDGRYEVHVPAAMTTVRVSAGGEPPHRDVAPGATGVDFVVPRQGTLRYRIVAGDGRPVAGARAYVRSANDGYFSARWWSDAPDPDGYRQRRLPYGVHDLLASAAGLAPALQQVTIGAEPVAITLTLPLGCDVTLRPAAGGEPAPERLRVWLHEAIFDAAGLKTPPRIDIGDLGRRVPFATGGTLRAVMPGRHRLIASDPAIEIVPAVVEVVPDSAPTFELRWRRR